MEGWLSGQDGVRTGGCGREGALRARCCAGAHLPTSVLWPSLVSRVLVLGTAGHQARQPGSASHSRRAQTRWHAWCPPTHPPPGPVGGAGQVLTEDVMGALPWFRSRLQISGKKALMPAPPGQSPCPASQLYGTEGGQVWC